MRKLPLTHGKFALVDGDLFDFLNQYKWHYHHTGYAMTTIAVSGGKFKKIMLHRMIIPIIDSQHIDHKDRNKLNCLRENLRISNPTLNNANKSLQRNNKTGYRGVYFRKDRNKFVAGIRINKKYITLGLFDNAVDAAKAYNKRAIATWGEFAWLNPIDN